jgi:hypothetical protein
VRQEHLTRLISAPVFRLKGGGWYETDFKSDKEGKRNLAVEKDEAAEARLAAKPAEDGRPSPPRRRAPKPEKVEATSVAVKKPAGRRRRPRSRDPQARCPQVRGRASGAEPPAQARLGARVTDPRSARD